jgi:hypothetical protein
LILLLNVWALFLVVGFALLHYATGSQFRAPDRTITFGTDLYFSGTTFSTLGLGDVTPIGRIGRTLAIAEAGLGFGFLGIVIGYLPVLYAAFSRREASISLLDARASSPPTAGELLRRHALAGHSSDLKDLLKDWERWSAELLESHLSYPVLCYYRSQHDHQSWLASLAAIMDTSALIMAVIDDIPSWQAQLTFAMARHAVVDLTLVLNVVPVYPGDDRLSDDTFGDLASTLKDAGMAVTTAPAAVARLRELRSLYEPYLASLSRALLFDLPPFLSKCGKDDWELTAWDNYRHF